MSSADRHRLRAGLAVLGIAAFLGGCQVQPLYQATSASGAPLTAELTSIYVAPAPGRMGQIIRNDLLFLLNGGGQEGNAYELRLRANATTGDVIVRLVGGEPQGRLLNVRAEFALFRREDLSQPIFQGSVTRQATYEWTNQRFANDRAEKDARERAAAEVAEEIRVRLAAFFAQRANATPQMSPPIINRSGRAIGVDIGETDLGTDWN